MKRKDLDDCCSCGCESGLRERHSIFTFKFFISVLGFVIFLAAHIPDKLFGVDLWYLYVVAYLLLGREVIISCIKGLLKGQVFTESFLMTLASAAALILGDFTEAVAVMLFYQLGQFFLSLAVRNSRQRLKKDSAEGEGGHVVPSQAADTLPDSDMEKLVSRFAKYYTPALLICAALLSILLPLIKQLPFSQTLPEILPFLVLACPCGIVISVPLAYFAGVSADKPPSAIRRVALENIVFILFVKAVVLIVGLITALPLFLAIFGDVGVTLLAILNSMKLLRGKRA